jgi:hypothetical protein
MAWLQLTMTMPLYSAFNAQGSRVITVVVQLGASENICGSSGRRSGKKGKTG